MASRKHAYEHVRAHGEAGCTARPMPLAVDGLLYASSTVMLDAGAQDPCLARWLHGTGIAVTLAANIPMAWAMTLRPHSSRSHCSAHMNCR